MVRVKGLEPPRLAAPEPKSGASTNSATPAWSARLSKAFYGMREVKCIAAQFLAITSITTDQVAEVAELVDAPDLGSGAARCESSSLSFRTILI